MISRERQRPSGAQIVAGPSNRGNSLGGITAICLGIAIVAAGCGGQPAATTTTGDGERVVGAAADEGAGVRFVRVQHQVDEATADATLALLATNGFDEFTKEQSSGDGFDVVARGLTQDGASALVVRLTTDPDVPYPGVIFEAD